MEMDDHQTDPLLNWSYSYQQKSMDELRQSLLLTMELEEARLKAEDQLKLKDDQILHLKELLTRAIKDRDEAQEKCNKMFFDKMFLQQKLQKSTQHSSISSIEDDPRRGIDSNQGWNHMQVISSGSAPDSNNGLSSSDCDESIVSSPPPPPSAAGELPVVITRPLPEKGKLLQAVMKAGPLLQTLLLAGPLPQWRHPPPPVDAYQIPPPPVVVPPSTLTLVSACFLQQDALENNVDKCGRITRKRGLPECSDSSNELKYQRVVHQ